jgi:iron complex outermembrane recepter protein
MTSSHLKAAGTKLLKRGEELMRRGVIATVISLSVVGLSLAGNVRAMEIRQATDIPPQALGSALEELAKDRNFQIVYVTEELRDRRTQGVIGQFTPVEALTQLLKGTGLTFRSLDERTITIVPIGASVPRLPSSRGTSSLTGARPQKEGKAQPSQGFRMAQVAQGTAAGDSAVSSGSEPMGGQSGPALQEVIVTAQKYSQRAFDVPISMTVVGGVDLRVLGITNLEDLQFQVPGMYVDNDGTYMRVTLQGISNVAGAGALVGTYLDEADITSEASFGVDLNSYDLARVEVLKGPQGTLYGEGSLGGTIRYITNKPALDEFRAGADVTALFDQFGAPGDRVEGVVNAPLVVGRFGLRVAAELEHGGGWIDQPAANQKNINSSNLTDARLEGRWEPSGDVTLDLMEVIHRDTSGPVTGENPAGIYTQVFGLTTTPRLVDNYDISNVTLNWTPGPVAVVNSATYFRHYNYATDVGGAFQFTPPPSAVFQDYETFASTINESLSDEFRLSNASGADWRWTLGAFYKHLDEEIPPYLLYFGLPGPAGSPLPTPFPYYNDINSSAKSAFGDTNYRLLGKLVLGAGLRYFRDDENALPDGNTIRQQQTFTSVDPRFYARYGLSSDVNLYASAAKGFRSGGFNGLGDPPYQPEHVWTYTLGSKMRVLDGRMSVDADAFFSNYAQYQIQGIAPGPNPIDIIRNAGDVRIKGVEAGILWSPSEQWRLGLNGDYVDARLVTVAVIDSAYAVGDPLDYVPRYQLAGSVEREFRWYGKRGFARLDYTQRARATFRNRSIGPWYYSQSDYMYLLGLHVGINWTENLELGVFAQNLLNDRGYVGTDQIELFAPRQQPRTFGVSFKFGIE